ncbi:SCO family protein [Endozoicomonas ascidiicola]|uniref:SCO family protein n=1 Tax=Endozoicomonas ascidiicola TaxID=1698521 RepID=UPI000A424653|nr:SCO family protein [Endozoicomonas ascidiicola]
MRKTVFVLLSVIAVVLGLTFNKFLNKPALTKEQLQQMGVVVFDTPRSFTMGELVDHNGQPFTPERFKDRWTLVYYGFTFCPDICPATLSQLNKVDKLLKEQSPELAKKMQYVMVTVDPRRDTPEKLKGYVPHFNNDFIGVTGEITQIYNLATQMNVPFTPVVDPEDEFYLVDHGANLALVNPKGYYHGFIRPPFDSVSLINAFNSIIR